MTRIVMTTLLALLLSVPAARAQAVTGTPPADATADAAAGVADGKAGGDEDAAEDVAEDVAEGGGRSRAMKWFGVGLMSAGGALVLGSFTFNDSKGCGFFNELRCDQVGPVYRGAGAALIGGGLTLMLIDDIRHHKPGRRTSLAIGPRAVRVRVQF